MLYNPNGDHISTMATAPDTVIGTPWEDVGHSLPANATVDQTLNAAGLDWKVLKRQAWVDVARENASDDTDAFKPTFPQKVPGNHVLIREDTMTPLGPFVGSRYKPIQNADAFEVFRDFCDAGNMTMETAGSLRDGLHVWGLARMNETHRIGDGETINGYFLLMQSHSYGNALRAMFTPVRYPGGHMLVQAINKTTKAKQTYTMSHSREFTQTRVNEIKDLMGVAQSVLSDFVSNAQALIATGVTEAEAVRYFIEVFHPKLHNQIMHGIDDEIPTRIADLENWDRSNLNLRKVPTYMDEFAGSDLASCQGTAWGMLQATNHAFDHCIGRNADNRLEAVWMGPTATKKLGALKSAMSKVKKG